jgi:hypothetical protein
MLEVLFGELKNLIWGIGIISIVMLGLLILPKKISLKLGQYPLVLGIMFAVVIVIIIRLFN